MDLPVIFLIENNGYGLSTPVNEQYRCKSLVDRAVGYGMEASPLMATASSKCMTPSRAFAITASPTNDPI
jgi:hypothetical protein